MRIGINGYYLTTKYSGIGQYSSNLLHALSEIDKKNKYYIFVPNEVEWDFGDNFKQIVIRPFPFFEKTFFNRFCWEEYQLGNAIKKYRIDVFHGLYQSLPKGSENIGNVVTIHDAIPWRFPFERKQFSYRVYSDYRKDLVQKRAKKAITISETSKLDFATIYDMKPETIEVTYESVDPSFSKKFSNEQKSEFKKKYSIDKNYILYTGGLKRHKNLRMLIKSFAILVNEYGYKGDLFILGAVRKNMAISQFIYYRVEDLEKYVKMKNLNKRVRFFGGIPQDDMALFMQEAECFISLSLYEGFGLPVLEAMTSGTPSVLSNLGAYPEIAQDGGLFVYPYGPHRVAQALNSILSNKNLSEDLKNKGLRRSSFFDSKKIATRVLEIYQEVYDDYKISYNP